MNENDDGKTLKCDGRWKAVSCKQYKTDICRFALDPKGKPIGVAINNACHSSEMDQTCEAVCYFNWRQNNHR